MKIRDIQDARETLRMARMAYDAGAYQEAYDMLDMLSQYVAYTKGIPDAVRDDLRTGTLRTIGQFQFCPDECLWEMSGNLSDRLT